MQLSDANTLAAFGLPNDIKLSGDRRESAATRCQAPLSLSVKEAKKAGEVEACADNLADPIGAARYHLKVRGGGADRVGEVVGTGFDLTSLLSLFH